MSTQRKLVTLRVVNLTGWEDSSKISTPVASIEQEVTPLPEVNGTSEVSEVTAKTIITPKPKETPVQAATPERDVDKLEFKGKYVGPDNKIQVGPPATKVESKKQQPPPPPKNIRTLLITHEKMLIGWDQVDGADSYFVAVTASNPHPKSKAHQMFSKDLHRTYHEAENLHPDMTYAITICSLNKKERGAYSEAVFARTLSAPLPPETSGIEEETSSASNKLKPSEKIPEKITKFFSEMGLSNVRERVFSFVRRKKIIALIIVTAVASMSLFIFTGKILMSSLQDGSISFGKTRTNDTPQSEVEKKVTLPPMAFEVPENHNPQR